MCVISQYFVIAVACWSLYSLSGHVKASSEQDGTCTEREYGYIYLLINVNSQILFLKPL